jgi:hypothetical protein
MLMVVTSACRGLSGVDDLEFLSAGSSTGVGGGQGGEGGVGGAGGAGGQGGQGGQGGVAVSPGCTLPAGECPTVFISNTGVSVDRLAVDSKSIYWMSRGDSGPTSGSIWQAEKSGGQALLLVDKISPRDMVVDESDQLVFWIDNKDGEGKIRAISTSAPNPQSVLVVSGADPFGALAIGTGAQLIFFTVPSSADIARMASTAPANAEYIYSGSLMLQTDLVVSGETLYWTEADKVVRIESAAGPANPVNSITVPNGDPYRVYVHNGVIYYTVRTDNGAVKAMDQSTLLIMTLASGQPFPSHIHATATHAYWGSDSDLICLFGGSVRRIDLGSDAVETLAEAVGCPTNFVEDATHIYFGAGSTIYRIAK